jgi:hypothetical protein
VQADYMYAAEVGTISFGGALKEQQDILYHSLYS